MYLIKMLHPFAVATYLVIMLRPFAVATYLVIMVRPFALTTYLVIMLRPFTVFKLHIIFCRSRLVDIFHEVDHFFVISSSTSKHVMVFCHNALIYLAFTVYMFIQIVCSLSEYLCLNISLCSSCIIIVHYGVHSASI